jgi:putative endonuclease
MHKKKQRHEQKGRWAEKMAIFFLKLKGYRILSQRFKTPLGEIDIIAVKRGILVGIEVKARSTFDEALWAVTPAQQNRIINAMKIFLTRAPKWASAHIRFDVILVRFPFIKHLKHAWSE